jgi:uncharacterized hydrophobic protein (TIGR00271 family)
MSLDDRNSMARARATGRLINAPRLRKWWRRAVVESVDHKGVIGRITDESGLSPRYAFMTMMSAGIAVLGLLLSSPAVVIGAMLISPLMNPILGFGFSLARFDFVQTRRSLLALTVGSLLAVAFAALIVIMSPLREATSEIISRTRPNLFDLLVALFAALAGVFAIIKGLSGAIVGVAIATALMPPLAVVGYGLATWNLPVLGGALALFVTNFVTIALSATLMARFYGFGHSLARHQSWIQTGLLILVFVGLSVPLGLSLQRIAAEAATVAKIRTFLEGEFGARARVTQLAVDFEATPLAVRSVLIAPRPRFRSSEAVRDQLAKQLGRPITLQLDQILVDRNASSLESQRVRLGADHTAVAVARAEADRVAEVVGASAGQTPGSVILDRDHRRAEASVVALPGADVEAYRALELRTAAAAGGWRIVLIPPFGPLPVIRFAGGSDVVDAAARRAILSSAWAAQRWNSPALRVPGLPVSSTPAPKRPTLAQRRARAIADVLRGQGVQAVSAPAAGRAFRLSLSAASAGP